MSDYGDFGGPPLKRAHAYTSGAGKAAGTSSASAVSDYDELVTETMAQRPAVDAILTKKAQRARIAAALRALRVGKGLSQRKLSARTGWTQPFIARLESIVDDQMPAPETIIRYAEACGAKVGLVFVDQEGGDYRVGNAVALTDDPDAIEYLNGLVKAAETQTGREVALRLEFAADIRQRAREEAQRARRIAERAVEAAREEAERQGLTPEGMKEELRHAAEQTARTARRSATEQIEEAKRQLLAQLAEEAERQEGHSHGEQGGES